MKNLTLKSLQPILFILFMLCQANRIVAQNNHASTVITLDEGISDQMAERLENSIESLLVKVNELIKNQNDTFATTEGEQQLKNLVSERGLSSVFDSLKTYALVFEDEVLEVPKIFLKPETGGKYEVAELTFRFTKEGEFIEALVSQPKHNVDRILTRSIMASEREKQEAIKFLQSYSNALEQKNAIELRTLIEDDAHIVVGKLTSGDQTQYVRSTPETYVDRLASSAFQSSDSIHVTYDSVQVFRHPDFESVLGIRAFQNWKMSSYSDRGNMFFIVDISGDHPRMAVRSWKESVFKAGEFTQIQPDPLGVSIVANKLSIQKEESLQEGTWMPINEGKIIFRFSSNSELINQSILKKWISQKTLTFSNVSLDTSSIEMIADNLFSVHFSIPWTQGTQEIESEIQLQETTLLFGLKTETVLYLQAQNEFEIIVGDNVNALSESKFASPMGSVKIATNQNGTNHKIITSGGETLLKSIHKDSVNTFTLRSGNYIVELSKEGFHPIREQISILPQKEVTLNLELLPIVIAEPVSPAKNTRKWAYIIAGAATLVGGSAILLSQSSSGGTTAVSIPIPPGRP